MPALGGYREYDDRRLPERMRVLEKTGASRGGVLRSERSYDACEWRGMGNKIGEA